MSLDDLSKLLLEESEEEKKEEKKEEEKKEEKPEKKETEVAELELPEVKEETTEPEKPETPSEKELFVVEESVPKEEKTEAREEAVSTTAGEGIIIPPEIEKALEKIPEPREEEGAINKYVILIYGDKGVGKTTTALSFPGEILVLSFDRKAMLVKKNMFGGDKRIHVFDVVKYMDYSTDETMLKTAELVYLYTIKVLDYASKHLKPDWVVIDGAEIFQQIAEWVMRYRHGLKPFEGIRNLNLWKYRKQLIRDIHNKALNIAKRGVIYTTNIEYQDIVVEGELVTRKDVPKWIDILIYETDVVLKAVRDPRTREFKVEVVTSKDDKLFPTGETYTVTDKPLGKQIKWEKVFPDLK